MSIGEAKELAKQKYHNNKWNLWWPLLVIGVLTSIIQNVFEVSPDISISNAGDFIKIVSNYHIPPIGYVGMSIVAIISGLLYAGYLKYVVNFTRTGKFDAQDIINTIKDKWLDIIIAVILTSVIVAIGFALLIIPGFILAFAYALAIFLVIDKDAKGYDALKMSRETMRGHKFDYFAFVLSFIGWALLIPLTLGIAAIWVVPYFNTANAIYLDYLAKDVK